MNLTDENIKKRLTNKLQRKLEEVSNQRERNVNKYIIPLEIKMSELRDKIREKGAEPLF